jgi:hypothetical protein
MPRVQRARKSSPAASISRSRGRVMPKIPVRQEQLNTHPDTLDFRDKMYVPTLVEVPTRIPLEQYRAYYKNKKVPVLDQGKEGACTGFGLAAVANFLLQQRRVVPDSTLVSPRMLYEMARRYDEWPGEAYSGSSARGAMKGWHKHGVCADSIWSYDADTPGGTLTHARALNAAGRPLGAYFRVNHQEIVAMHSALAEVGILFATGTVHKGWGQIGADGVIPFTAEALGGHAFAIVGYDERGFWIQNSWTETWGKGGFALITYDDWLANGTDVWVGRLGAPVNLAEPEKNTKAHASLSTSVDFSFTDLRPHIISVGNNGFLRPDGTFGTTEAEVKTLFAQDLPRITSGWAKKRLLLYAHGGLVGENDALQRVEEYREPLLDAQVYPLAFIWKTDFLTTVRNILQDALARRRPEGPLDAAKDFMLDRLDDTLEPLARVAGKPLWSEMKENALLATTQDKGGARLVLIELAKLLAADPAWDIHVAGHSAGSIFMAPLVQLWCAKGRINGGPAKGLTGLGGKIASLTLWAPACTMELFDEAYLPSIQDKSVRRFSLFTLKDAAELDDDCASIYHKSLLYLVSNALENKSGLFSADGEPLLGLERFIIDQRDVFQIPTETEIKKTNPPMLPLFGVPAAQWIRSPNGLPEGESANASHARHHGDFDDDRATVLSTLARITLARPGAGHAAVEFAPSPSSLRDRRRTLV